MPKSTATALTAFLAVIMILSVPQNWAQAGRIEPGLQERLLQASPDEFFPVVIRPVGTVPGSILQKQVATQYRTRKQRHRAAIEALQTTAKTTQAPILRALEQPVYKGRVRNVKDFWIDNVIAAEMTSTAIAELANRRDIDEIVYLPPIEMMKSRSDVATVSPADVTAGTAQAGLRAIKADSLWKLGYTGKGRLVASIDTGVDGEQIFLADKWRGNNGYTVDESWFNPQEDDEVPRALLDAHGTQVMGIMVAIQDEAVSGDPDLDTVGVAFDAQWISAGVIDILGSSILEAMQWISDPDGDPNTELDVPDAVANAWGVIVTQAAEPCLDVFWNAIDNVEAAGTAMIFAAGNEGLFGPQSIRNPANRATTEINAFGVGMIADTSATYQLDPRSSRGPSLCNGSNIKPNVVAPGVEIQSTYLFDLMAQNLDGTSYSTPHVAGGIALLREYNPNATVEEIKTALINSTVDLGPSGPDNSYGYGLIDLAAALELLPPNDEPSLYIKRDYYMHPAPGTSTEMVIVLRSSGPAVSGVSVNVVAEDPQLTVINGSAPFGSFTAVGDTAGNFDDPFVIEVDENVLEGERLPLRFEIFGDGSYTRVVQGALQVGPERTVEVYTHDAGNFRMTVSAFGMFGLQLDGLNPRAGGIGYFYGGDDTESLFEGAFLVGIDADHVSDNARDRLSFPDFDFQVDPGGRLEIMEPGDEFAEETRAAFSDAIAENPIGLFIVQRTMVSDDPENDDYLVAEYTIHNRSGATLTNLRPGLYFDWDFPWLNGNRDTTEFNPTAGVAWMRSRDHDRYRGLAVLTQPGITSHRPFNNADDIFVEGFTEAIKWEALTHGTGDVPLAAGDRSQLIATGPFTLEPDESVTVAFAVIGATSEDSLIYFTQNALALYQAGGVTLNPASLSFTAQLGSTEPIEQSLTIRNQSAVEVEFSVAEESLPDWVEAVTPMTGNIISGESASLVVSVNAVDLDEGTYSGSIPINTTFPETPLLSASVSLEVISSPIDPNPFNPKTAPDGIVRLQVPIDEPGRVRTTIYDLTGEEVVTLPEAQLPGDNGYAVTWDGQNHDGKLVASGVYLCRIEGIDVKFARTYKVVLKK